MAAPFVCTHLFTTFPFFQGRPLTSLFVLVVELLLIPLHISVPVPNYAPRPYLLSVLLLLGLFCFGGSVSPPLNLLVTLPVLSLGGLLVVLMSYPFKVLLLTPLAPPQIKP